MSVFPKQFVKVPDSSGAGQGSPSQWKAPRLSKALLEAIAGKEPYRTTLEKVVKSDAGAAGHRGAVTLTEVDKEKMKAELGLLLGHLRERLQGNLDEAWMSSAGYDSPEFEALLLKARQASKDPSEVVDASNADLAEAAKFYDSGEERWARAFTEMVVFSMYHTPGMAYANALGDADWFARFPATYAIAMACQTLSTYCLLSRGFTKDQVGAGGLSCSAGSASAKAFGAQKIKPMVTPTDKTMADVPEGTPEKEKSKVLAGLVNADLLAKGNKSQNLGDPGWATSGEVVKLGGKDGDKPGAGTPGSVVIYNGGGSAYNGQNVTVGKTHIASALRISGSRIQWIDTGVVVGTDGTETSAEGGTVDHGFQNGTVTSSTSVVAIAGAKKVEDGKLVPLAKAMAGAKPIGVSRLAIARADTKRVLFVSKLLHMRWPVAKLLWSLRGLPTEGLVVAWLVWVPQCKGATAAAALADAAPAASPAPAGILRTAAAALPPKQKLTLRLANVLVGTDGGKGRCFRSRVFSEWRQDFGTGNSPPDEVTGWKLGDDDKSPKIIEWCENPDNFDQCYFRTMASDDAGSMGRDPTPDTLVDPGA